MKKIKAAALSVIMSVFLGGCDVPSDLKNQYTCFYRAGFNDITITNVDFKHSEFAEKCFKSIEIFGATLALPMNVSDLPDDFTVNYYAGTPASSYNGFKIISAEILCDGIDVLDAMIMYPNGGNPSDGQIVEISFHYSLLGTKSKIILGETLDNFSADNVFTLLGECEKNGYIIYELSGGKTIRLTYTDPDCKCLFSAELSVIGTQSI